MGEKMKSPCLRAGNRIPLRAETVFPQDGRCDQRHRLAGDKLMREKVKQGCIGEGMGVQSGEPQEYESPKDF